MTTCNQCGGSGSTTCVSCGGTGTAITGRCRLCAGACAFVCSVCAGTGDVDPDEATEPPAPRRYDPITLQRGKRRTRSAKR